jgi:signal transduction histidine kinase
VATLVAREAPQAEVFTAIAEEVGQILGTEEIRMWRYAEGGTAVVVASCGGGADMLPVGSRHELGGENAVSGVARARQPVRIDDYGVASGPIGEPMRAMGIRGVAGAPIVVEGRPWGVMVAATRQDAPLPEGTESRLDQFTELMAIAISNTESRAKADRLTEEQAALRRVATLVAQGAAPTAVFDAVAAEVAGLLEADAVALSRYESDDAVTVVAQRRTSAWEPPSRSRRSHDVEAPVTVDGRLWGAIAATWAGPDPPPYGTEQRMAQFAELLDTAIANADSRNQLTASRARLLTAGDEARRRVVRDLHDGAQQRLVNTILTLKLAQRAFEQGDDKAESLVAEALGEAQQGKAELRELAHGILPAVLTRGGLCDAVHCLVSKVEQPVDVQIAPERFPEEIEASAYFITAEALTNVVKHSRARRAEVQAFVHDRVLHVEIRDDGVGGADPEGHGLVGIGDRVTALEGSLTIESPPGGGTRVAAALPIRID